MYSFLTSSLLKHKLLVNYPLSKFNNHKCIYTGTIVTTSSEVCMSKSSIWGKY